MKYYVIEISLGDSKIAGRAVYEYESEKDAVAVFHSKLGTAMKSELFDSELIIVTDEDGKMLKREKYINYRPIKEPDPEEELPEVEDVVAEETPVVEDADTEVE